MPTHPIKPQHHLCPACGHRIVQAQTSTGVHVALDTGLRAYALVLNADNTTYRAESSHCYPVHSCRGTKDAPDA